MSFSTPPGPPDENTGGDVEDKLLEAKIAERLNEWYAPPPLHERELLALHQRYQEKTKDGVNPQGLAGATRSYFGRRVIGLALAASVLVAYFGLQLLPNPEAEVVFNRQNLAAVYDDLVARGFQPYYLCDDMARFRDTMQHRHGQAITLSDRGNQLMLGLSYPGGWTPETTAILFRFEGRPVVIFVDDQPPPKDTPRPADESEISKQLNLRVKNISKIYLVEVSPLTESLLDTILPAGNAP